MSSTDSAPTFTGALANDDQTEFDLSDHIGDGPVVLAFFPGAFTPPCSSEMDALQEHYDRFEEAGAHLFGVSADSPFTQQAFKEDRGLEFDLVSDMNREAINAYDLEIDVPELGLHGAANRAVYVIDDDGQITYRWVADEPDNEPDYEELLDAVESA